MTVTTRLSVITLAILASAPTGPAAAARRSPAHPAVAAPQGEPTIVGAWRTRIRPRNCETGEVPPIAGFPGQFTFHEGGTTSEFGVPPGMSPAMRGPGYGVWRREPGWQHYTFSFTYYRYDASGAYAGRQKVVAALELDASGDAFTSNSAIEAFDASDNLIMTACGNAVGSRFQ